MLRLLPFLFRLLGSRRLRARTEGPADPCAFSAPGAILRLVQRRDDWSCQVPYPLQGMGMQSCWLHAWTWPVPARGNNPYRATFGANT